VSLVCLVIPFRVLSLLVVPFRVLSLFSNAINHTVEVICNGPRSSFYELFSGTVLECTLKD
jgi:hypothetical protein